MSVYYQDHMDTARESLTQARRALAGEMAAYPTPISGCDAQYNHLLAERRRINRALKALAEDVFIATPRSPEMSAGVESR